MASFFKKRSVKYGVPFLLLVVGGSFGLREFAQLRYQFSRVSAVKRDDFKKAGLDVKEPVTLESEYEKISKIDIDNWEQVRGPRPWEENVNN